MRRASNVNDSTELGLGGSGWKLAKCRFTGRRYRARGRSRLFVRGKQRPSNRASAPSSSLSTVVPLLASGHLRPRIDDVHPSVANWKLFGLNPELGENGGWDYMYIYREIVSFWFPLTLKYFVNDFLYRTILDFLIFALLNFVYWTDFFLSIKRTEILFQLIVSDCDYLNYINALLWFEERGQIR